MLMVHLAIPVQLSIPSPQSFLFLLTPFMLFSEVTQTQAFPRLSCLGSTNFSVAIPLEEDGDRRPGV